MWFKLIHLLTIFLELYFLNAFLTNITHHHLKLEKVTYVTRNFTAKLMNLSQNNTSLNQK
jgi:hypothetical protein